MVDTALGKEGYQGSSGILQLEQDSGKSLGRNLCVGPDLRHRAALVKYLVLLLEKLDNCMARRERGEESLGWMPIIL